MDLKPKTVSAQVPLRLVADGYRGFDSAGPPAWPSDGSVPLKARLASIFAVFLALNLAATLASRILLPMSDVWLGTVRDYFGSARLLCVLPLPLAAVCLWLVVEWWLRRLARGKRPWLTSVPPKVPIGLCLLLLIPQNIDITSAIGKSSVYSLARWIHPPVSAIAHASKSIEEVLLCRLAALTIYCFVLAGNAWSICRWCDQSPNRREGAYWGAWLAAAGSLITIPALPSLWRLRVVLSYPDLPGGSYYMPHPGLFVLRDSNWRIDVFFMDWSSGGLLLSPIVMALICLPCLGAVLLYRKRSGLNGDGRGGMTPLWPEMQLL